MRREKQKGVALLTVLLLVATIAVLAVAMTEIMTRSLGRAAAGEARDQGFWALAGLEAAAIGYLEEQGEAIDQPVSPLFQQPVVLPFEGGTATISFSERSNCFNVNDLVARSEDEGGYVTDQAAGGRFADLVEAVGGSRNAGQQLAARIADFIDADDDPNASSQDDYDYRRREVPYRTASTLLASVSELRAISGFSRDVYRPLAGYLCALPTDEVQMLNVNTLTPEDAPLLKAAAGDALTMSGAMQIIAQRSPAGYDDVSAFLEQPLLAGRDLPSDMSTMLTTKSNHIEMEIVVQTAAGRLRQVSRISRADGEPIVIERRIGERLP
ncbi:type II secretion system minor pseudopilin GspK [Parvularcula sp. ZS-1/3]|uniref:Type II secretion system protein K n=1 Tax=Parvularcula mediterranea TaxID=2732508 RepID=A0A7Y3W6B4_9PROT|nr:type II secretion system minor pseudopilin GspK [Parvularcula mediterranea]NNU17106.1 type II secretion system minor pseudopilin GspK [Parvularcula mediterranea]